MAQDAGHILVVDDEEAIRDSCERILAKMGFAVTAAADAPEAYQALGDADQAFDLVVLDLILPGGDGLSILKSIRKKAATPVIIISGHGTVRSAVEAMKLGAMDFLPKPFTPNELRQAVKKALSETAGDAPGPQLGRVEQASGEIRVVYRSKAMERIMEMARRVGPTDSTVLITGESGTGKGVIARYIHSLSPRSAGPFVAVDCGTLVETLFESELFGHTKGAFTGAAADKVGKFELADGGTIFFDEISNINLEVQAKLLRAVEDREISKVGSHKTVRVDVRILAATNEDLTTAIREGKFREDLFYRLNVVSIHLPPLRQRPEDIEPIAAFFTELFSLRAGGPPKTISPEVMTLLRGHDWPGNVRELANTIERLVVLGGGAVIEPEDLAFAGWKTGAAATGSGLSLGQMEREHIIRVLEHFEGNRTEAAQALGIDRKTLREKIKRYGL